MPTSGCRPTHGSSSKDLEITASCSNPFLQIWKGGIKPVFDSKDDLAILAGIASGARPTLTGDKRFHDHFKFEHEGKRGIYIQRLLDTCTTTAGYKLDDIMAGKYGPPGGALLLFRTYPRIPFYEQVHDSVPVLHRHRPAALPTADDPTAIECGENFIVHREGPEATPYLPNVIVSSNPLVRPERLRHPARRRALGRAHDPQREAAVGRGQRDQELPLGERLPVLLPDAEVAPPRALVLVERGLASASGTRTSAIPYRLDKRAPNVGEHQLHMNPQAARDLGINDGDYVYVDANPADRPYLGATPDDPFYKVAALHAARHVQPRVSVQRRDDETRAVHRDGEEREGAADAARRPRALGRRLPLQFPLRLAAIGHAQLAHADAPDRHAVPQNEGDRWAFIFGGEADNHAVNTVPKERLIRVTKAEDGGLGGKGIWKPATTGYTPDNESDLMKRYLAGDFTKVKTLNTSNRSIGAVKPFNAQSPP